MVGGYEIIDFGGISLDTSVIVPGIYDMLESAQKPVLLRNFTINGIEQKPLFPTVRMAGSNFILFFGIVGENTLGRIFVQPNDDVAFSSSQIVGGSAVASALGDV